MLSWNKLFCTSRYLRWAPQLIVFGLALILPAACSANPTQPQGDLVNPARLSIRFQNDRGEPPQEINIKVRDGGVITITREQPLSGGTFRYHVPVTSGKQLQEIVRQLDSRPDIDYVELDQRRRID